MGTRRKNAKRLVNIANKALTLDVEIHQRRFVHLHGLIVVETLIGPDVYPIVHLGENEFEGSVEVGAIHVPVA